MESPTLFVLVDKPKQILFTIPKRAFPDEKSQDWFRALAKQLETAISPAGEAFVPGRFAGKGVALTVQMGFRDYLARMLTSWRWRGMGLGMMVLCVVFCLVAPEPEHAVNSRGKTMVLMLIMLVPILTSVFFVVTLVSWLSEKKFMGPRHMALSNDGIQFAGHDGSGLRTWSTYRYYLENRWAFFVWNPRGSLWFMLPKRQFASPMDIEQCRELLRTNLTASRWFTC